MKLSKYISVLLLMVFTCLACHNTLEWLRGKNFHDTAEISGFSEIEEENNAEEESKEEKNEECNFEDDFFHESFENTRLFLVDKNLIALNKHYHSADYSSQFYCPPEFI